MSLVTVLTVGAALVLQPSLSTADVTAVKGSAYGQYANVRFGEGTPTVSGPSPTVALPAGGSTTPVTSRVESSGLRIGPAQLFSSGPIVVSTQGTTGPGGSVMSSADVQGVNTSGAEVFTAGRLQSRCTASETGVASGTTTIEGGSLQVDSGDDDPSNSIPDHAPVTVPVPVDPPVNTSFEAHIHLGDSTGSFRYVFNEQTVNSDGSITVNAAHQYLGGFASGELIVGQSVCGVGTTSGGATTTTAPQGATTTLSSGAPFQSLVMDIICRVLRQLRSVPFLTPFIDPLLAQFGCPVLG